MSWLSMLRTEMPMACGLKSPDALPDTGRRVFALHRHEVQEFNLVSGAAGGGGDADKPERQREHVDPLGICGNKEDSHKCLYL